MQRGADKLRARCFMKQHASRDARVPGSLAAQPRPASVAPSAGGTTASRPDRPTPRHSSVSPRARVHPRDGRTTPPYGVRHLHGRATYRPTLPTDEEFIFTSFLSINHSKSTQNTHNFSGLCRQLSGLVFSDSTLKIGSRESLTYRPIPRV